MKAAGERYGGGSGRRMRRPHPRGRHTRGDARRGDACVALRASPPPHRFGYWTALIIPKIGRYIATIMPPTMTPSTTIMMGSIRDSRAETAASTSSS